MTQNITLQSVAKSLDNDSVPYSPISMKGVDCTQEQIDIVTAVWPTFQNSRVSNEFILDASEFKEPDTHRLSCIFKMCFQNVAGSYVLLVVN